MSLWIRQIHRWLSMVFTVLVIANFVANGAGLDEQLTMALGGITLIPLFLLLFSGLYLFALPYLRR
jgi:hypothetical protein